MITASLSAVLSSYVVIVQVCLGQLAKKFPRSPRVDVLQGIRIEASERPDIALQYYDQLLDADPSNAVSYLCLAIRSGSHESPRRQSGKDEYQSFDAPESSRRLWKSFRSIWTHSTTTWKPG